MRRNPPSPRVLAASARPLRALITLLGWSLLSAFVPRIDAATQIINLQPGWNAVYLEIDPQAATPNALFAGQPITLVAAWFSAKTKVTSLTDPAAVATKASEWHIWRPASSPSAFLNDLFEIQGGRALLIQASAATSLTIEGPPRQERRRWFAPSFNFTGFDVNPAAPLTFARYFDGSRAHDEMRIFTLAADGWTAVPPSALVERGRAYWVWTEEGTDFQGPLDLSVSLNSDGAAEMPQPGTALSVELRTHGSLPLVLEVSISDPSRVTMLDGSAQPAPVGSRTLVIEAGKPTTLILQRSSPIAASSTAPVIVEFRGGGLLKRLPIRL